MASAVGLFCLAAFLGSLFTGCNRGSEVENELREGRLYYADGQPAAGARVRLYEVGHAPVPSISGGAEGLIFSTTTDERGGYTLDSVPEGEYNILGEKDGKYSLLDSVFLNRSRQDLEPDTLKGPASVGGVVGMEPNHDPRTVLVQVLGTATYANVDRQGRFEIGPLAEGKYLLRLITTEEGYTPTIFPFRVKAAEALVMPDTLRLIYTGIPVVRGLSARFDTLNQIVTLNWRSVDYPNLDVYYVLRGEAEDVGPNLLVVGQTRDTLFRDSSFREVYSVPGAARRLEYRVRVFNRSEKIGESYESVEVDAPPRSMVETFIALEGNEDEPLRASINDTLRIIAKMTNPTRALREIRWNVWGQPQMSRSKPLAKSMETDTFTIVSPEAFNTFLEIRTVDESGTEWKRVFSVQVVGDSPVALPGPDTLVTLGDTAILVGRESDEFGSIVKREWDIGGRGEWRTVGAGEPVAAPGPTFLGDSVICQYRVTDDDGLTGVGRKILRGIAQRTVPLPAGKSGTGDIHGVDGELFTFLDPGPSFHSYHPVTRKWTARKAFPGDLLLATEPVTAELEGLIYTFAKSAGDSTILYAYDPKLDQWSEKKALREVTDHAWMLALDGKLYAYAYEFNWRVQGTKRLWRYDPAADAWTLLAYPPQNVENFDYWTSIDGKIILPYLGKCLSYDPATDNWSDLGVTLSGELTKPVEGRLPYFQNNDMILRNVFDDSRSETIRLPFQYIDWRTVTVIVGSRIYFFIEANFDGKGPILVFNFDVKTRQWNQGRPIQAGFEDENPGVHVLNGRIYLRDETMLFEYFE